MSARWIIFAVIFIAVPGLALSESGPTTAPASEATPSLEHQLSQARHQIADVLAQLQNARSQITNNLSQDNDYQDAKKRADDAAADLATLRKANSPYVAAVSEQWLNLKSEENAIFEKAMAQDPDAKKAEADYAQLSARVEGLIHQIQDRDLAIRRNRIIMLAAMQARLEAEPTGSQWDNSFSAFPGWGPVPYPWLNPNYLYPGPYVRIYTAPPHHH